MNVVQTYGQWRRLDERLHRTVAKATHDALLLLLYDTLRAELSLNLSGRMEEVFGGQRAEERDRDRALRVCECHSGAQPAAIQAADA